MWGRTVLEPPARVSGGAGVGHAGGSPKPWCFRGPCCASCLWRWPRHPLRPPSVLELIPAPSRALPLSETPCLALPLSQEEETRMMRALSPVHTFPQVSSECPLNVRCWVRCQRLRRTDRHGPCRPGAHSVTESVLACDAHQALFQTFNLQELILTGAVRSTIFTVVTAPISQVTNRLYQGVCTRPKGGLLANRRTGQCPLSTWTFIIKVIAKYFNLFYTIVNGFFSP